jgi:hypothetical protein
VARLTALRSRTGFSMARHGRLRKGRHDGAPSDDAPATQTWCRYGITEVWCASQFSIGATDERLRWRGVRVKCDSCPRSMTPWHGGSDEKPISRCNPVCPTHSPLEPLPNPRRTGLQLLCCNLRVPKRHCDHKRAIDIVHPFRPLSSEINTACKHLSNVGYFAHGEPLRFEA